MTEISSDFLKPPAEDANKSKRGEVGSPAVRELKKARALPFPERYTVSEVAPVLRMEPAKLRELCARGEIAYQRQGKSILFFQEYIDAYDERCHRPVHIGKESRS